MPIIGMVQVYFTQQPQISWAFDGVINIPGLQTAMKDITLDLIRDNMVLPNLLTIKL